MRVDQVRGRGRGRGSQTKGYHCRQSLSGVGGRVNRGASESDPERWRERLGLATVVWNTNVAAREKNDGAKRRRMNNGWAEMRESLVFGYRYRYREVGKAG